MERFVADEVSYKAAGHVDHVEPVGREYVEYAVAVVAIGVDYAVDYGYASGVEAYAWHHLKVFVEDAGFEGVVLP